MNVGFRLNQARKKDEYSSVEVSANLFFDDPEIIEAYKKLLVAAGVQKKNEYSSIIANHSFDDSMIEIGKKLLEAAQKKSSL